MPETASFTLPADELVHLRALVRRQAEIAALPVMARRKALWTAMNDAVPGARPPFVIETWTFDRDFLPGSLLQCKSAYGRRLEQTFLRHIRHHELLDDDHVCPDTLDMGWRVWSNEFGIEIKTDYVKDSEGIVTGYHFDHPITDLNDGFDMVQPATFGVDRDATLAEKTFLEESFGDILAVVIRSGTYGNNNITQRLMRLMSMETFFTALYDCPDTLSDLLAMLGGNARRMAQWAEAEGLLVLNNGNQCTCGSCYNFTTLLPPPDADPARVRLRDMWTAMDSQETVGVSPQLFAELVFPHYRELAELYGMVYWGCCEPADPIWETSLSKLPNLKAVSISRWADQATMAEALDGTGIVFSRKPDPNLLGLHRELDEAAWRAEIGNPLEIVTRLDVPLEFVVRDVYSMQGNLPKAKRAVDIAREEIARVFGPVG